MGILEGKAVAVTGSGRGIGRGHCLHLADAGAKVVVNDLDLEEAEKVVAEIGAKGGEAIADGCDVSTREGARGLVGHCAEAFGRIDALVSNAGIVRDRSFLKMTDEEFDAVIRVHLRGTFLGCQEAALRMREQGSGGVLINTTSAAHFGNFGQANYSAAKGGIASMTYTLALELARFGIRVNAISPSGSTRMTENLKMPDGSPLPYIDPAQNGPVVVFLCSDEANYVTGQVFGTGSGRLNLLSHPKYQEGETKEGGLSLDDVRKIFQEKFRNQLEPLGIMNRPYPFYDGIQPSAK
jgi:3-oxoacyl-[acyl-carrier protein] reductase